MRRAMRSLRFRLTLAYVLIFGVLQLLVWITVDVARTNYLYRQFDQSMIELAQTMGAVMNRAIRQEVLEINADTCSELLNFFESPKTAIQVRKVGGDVIWRSTVLLGYELPMPHELQSPTTSPETQSKFENLTGRKVGTLGGEDETIRVFSLLLIESARGPYALQVAQSLAPLDSVRDDIRWLLVLFGVTSMVLAGATSWIMVGRTMQPIGRIAREAREISTSRLERRLPRPGTGDEFAELIDVINDMLGRLEREFSNQRQFVANVAHELKTPLTVLLGEVQAVQRKRGEVDVADFAEKVRAESRRMLRTVESFLILSRVQRGDRLSIVNDVPIAETLLEAVQACQEAARGRSVRIVPRMEVDEAAPEPVVRGDGDLLRSMIENLIHNAVRHSPDDGVVRVETSIGVKDVSIIVADDGPGIPDERLTDIFEPFIQADPTRTSPGSAGIGLAIVKGVAGLHGGTVFAENAAGGGARFCVRLPLASPA